MPGEKANKYGGVVPVEVGREMGTEFVLVVDDGSTALTALLTEASVFERSRLLVPFLNVASRQLA